ncbi:hypothetical protein LTR33_010530 [Friedmanniomyces endolithicus]|nr:hypothetical protein LTR33_010530 [Friedmanniomyces endolithicus]
MSGVEVVLGLVLGGIPLCISAMEHYADFKKVTGTFIDIRRQHGKDLRRVKLCELQFCLHLKQLLLPLLNDGIVDKPEYAELLLEPGGDGWKEKHVGEALEKRLDEGHQYYVETLKGMVATVAQLCKETYGLPANTTQPAQASTVLQLRANDVFHNAMFQGKRIKYAFTGTSRDALFDELEAQISTLRDILSDTDQVSALSQVEAKAPLQKVSKALLQFWSHADNFHYGRYANQAHVLSREQQDIVATMAISIDRHQAARSTPSAGEFLTYYTSGSIVVTTIDANAIKTSHTYAVGQYCSAPEEVQPPTASVAVCSQIA